MVAAIVYCELKGETDAGVELATVKGVLTEAVPSILPITIGADSNEQKVYANDAGSSLLGSFLMMETLIQELKEERVEWKGERKELMEKTKELTEERKELMEKTKELTEERKELMEKTKELIKETKGLREETKELKNKTEELSREVTILRPLQKTAINIRLRFFAVCQRRQGEGYIGLRAAIRAGNENAHDSDVVTDICLLENGFIDSERSFAFVYGISWQKAALLIDHKHMVTILNRRATIVVNCPEKWKNQAEFDDLISWTQNAGQDQWAEFSADEVGRTRPGRLYFNILRGSR